TSIYLVDRTIPMLPERLCNDLCSLKPNVDRPAYSVLFELDNEGKILKYEITKSTIHSDARLTYEQAYEVIQGKGNLSEELITAIVHLSEIAQKIRSKRFASGAINFERQEVKFILDEQGKPTDVYTRESNEAHQLIEEFMLLANRTVAQHVTEKYLKGHPKRAFIYRIHDLPNEAKLQDLVQFMMKLKYALRVDGNKEHVSKALNEMLVAFHGKPEQNMLETIVLKTMAKAIYTTDNIGHYGLGFPFYTHFTSPIRRYPDVLAHRYLWAYEHGQELDSPGFLESQARHCSDQEQLASQAERASIKFKQVEYMADKIGEKFDGTIISVTDFGFFVEIKSNGCEGLVPIHSIEDDFYVYDEKNFCLTGRQSKKVFKLGDSVKIEVDRVNFERKQIDFRLCEQ
ncbi:MAG: VacB/RNase II family 3'-5' exoribonuclease, partial [Porphyromonas sp.]|nr:VacB/RNase II family 3'-5' exoribonuclease [Porphyromonas sp.]